MEDSDRHRKKRKRLTRRRSSKPDTREHDSSDSEGSGSTNGKNCASNGGSGENGHSGRNGNSVENSAKDGHSGRKEPGESLEYSEERAEVKSEKGNKRRIPSIQIHLAPEIDPSDEENEFIPKAARIKSEKIDEIIEPHENVQEGNANEESVKEENEAISDVREEENIEKEEEVNLEEEEEERPEWMTDAERKDMYEAVKAGDIDLLEDLMDNPYADINMIWFSESLLMTAIRAEKKDMIEFLIDNGADINYQTSRMQVIETRGKERLEWYQVNCRQMAYDRGLQTIVLLIDFLNRDLFPWVILPPRIQRLWRPKDERLSRANSVMSVNEDGAEADVESESEADAILDDVDGNDVIHTERRKSKPEKRVEKSNSENPTTNKVSNSKDSSKSNSAENSKSNSSRNSKSNTAENSKTTSAVNSKPSTADEVPGRFNPSTPLTVRSCPTARSKVVTSVASRRSQSACRLTDTKSNITRRKTNRHKPELQPKTGSTIFESRSWRGKDFCPCATNSYSEPKMTNSKSQTEIRNKTKPVSYGGKQVRFSEDIQESRVESRFRNNKTVRKDISVEIVDTQKIFPRPLPPPRRAWESSSMTRMVTSLPEISRSCTRVNSTLYHNHYFPSMRKICL